MKKEAWAPQQVSLRLKLNKKPRKRAGLTKLTTSNILVLRQVAVGLQWCVGARASFAWLVPLVRHPCHSHSLPFPESSCLSVCSLSLLRLFHASSKQDADEVTGLSPLSVDLSSCSRVCRSWRGSASSLVGGRRFVPYFIVELDRVLKWVVLVERVVWT